MYEFASAVARESVGVKEVSAESGCSAEQALSTTRKSFWINIIKKEKEKKKLPVASRGILSECTVWGAAYTGRTSYCIGRRGEETGACVCVCVYSWLRHGTFGARSSVTTKLMSLRSSHTVKSISRIGIMLMGYENPFYFLFIRSFLRLSQTLFIRSHTAAVKHWFPYEYFFCHIRRTTVLK